MSNTASMDALLADALTSDYSADAVKEHRTTRSLILAALCAAVVTMVLGIALTQNRQQASQNSLTRQALIDRVKSSDARVASLEKNVRQAQYDLQAAEKAILAGTSLGDAAQKRLERLRQAAGYTPVTGWGVRVFIQDATPDPTISDGSVQPGHIMDGDLQMLVNGLWQAGATAVTVNNRRLTTTSAIRAAGEAILVDYRPLVPPYSVQAISDDADELAGRFRSNQAGLLLEQLASRYGVVWSLETIGRTTLPAATSNFGGN
jgi:uncharacterized protein YlxW (UPF0749 family)